MGLLLCGCTSVATGETYIPGLNGPISKNVPVGAGIGATGDEIRAAHGQTRYLRETLICDADIGISNLYADGRVRILARYVDSGRERPQYSTEWRQIAAGTSRLFNNVRLYSSVRYELQYRANRRGARIDRNSISARDCDFANNDSRQDYVQFEVDEYGLNRVR